jgi:hypothetical protein
MRHAARTVARLLYEYPVDLARRLVLEIIVVSEPEFRDAYLTAFGR